MKNFSFTKTSEMFRTFLDIKFFIGVSRRRSFTHKTQYKPKMATKRKPVTP